MSDEKIETIIVRLDERSKFMDKTLKDLDERIQDMSAIFTKHYVSLSDFNSVKEKVETLEKEFKALVLSLSSSYVTLDRYRPVERFAWSLVLGLLSIVLVGLVTYGVDLINNMRGGGK